jgi:hypothetical protein
MSNPDEIRQLGLSVGNAINVTATLAAAQTEADPVQYFVENVETVVAVVVDLQARKRAEAGLGAVVVDQPVVQPAAQYVPPAAQPSAQPNVVAYTGGTQQNPPAAPQQFAPAAPAAIPLAGNGTDPQVELNWQAFFQAVNNSRVAKSFQEAGTGQWFDNRAGKSAQAPDFKVKQGKGETGGPAVWINDKKNPAWVAEGLRQVGIS